MEFDGIEVIKLSNHPS